MQLGDPDVAFALENSALSARGEAVRQAWTRVLPIPALALFLILMVPHLGFVPLWDSRGYADAVVQAARFPPRISQFNVFGHPSAGFMLLVGAGQFIDPGNVYLLNAANMLFGLAGIVAFFAILRRCFPGPNQTLENGLVAVAFAVLPIVVGSELNLNPDTGVLVFSLLVVTFLLGGRYPAAAVAAFLLMNSKESGVLLYVIIIGLYLLVYVAAEPGGFRIKVREVWRRSLGFAPLFAVGFLWTASRFTAGGMRLMDARTTTFGDFLSLGLSGIRAANLTLVSIVNFNWIPACFIVAGCLVVLLRIARGRNRAPEGSDRRALGFLVAIAVCVLYALTRFQTFTNPRYLLPIFPFFVFGFDVALRVLIPSRRARLLSLIAFIVLAFVSCFRTIDPISKELYGTFRFGSHDLLQVSWLAGDFWGISRDQLTYNLEYTRIDSIQNKMFVSIRPDRTTTFVVDPIADWMIHGYLDPKTFYRTLKTEGSLRPRYLNTDRLFRLRQLPEVLYYVVYPTVPNADLHRLNEAYRMDWMRTFEDDGYSLPVLKMILRGPSVNLTGEPRKGV